jgi:hypothetical protein
MDISFRYLARSLDDRESFSALAEFGDNFNQQLFFEVIRGLAEDRGYSPAWVNLYPGAKDKPYMLMGFGRASCFFKFVIFGVEGRLAKARFEKNPYAQRNIPESRIRELLRDVENVWAEDERGVVLC